MKGFFISYNDTDRSWAEWIAWLLEEAGHSTIIQGDFTPGTNFIGVIEKSIKEAGTLIIVLSPDYLNSAFAINEFNELFDIVKAGKLLLVRVRECEPKGLLRGLPYIDLVGADEANARAALLEAVNLKVPLSNYQTTKKHSQSYQPTFPGNIISNNNHMLFSEFLNSIIVSFSTSPEAAWIDLHKLIEDSDSRKRARAAHVLGSIFNQIPNKENAWRDILRLAEDDVSNVRMWVAETLGTVFLYIPDKEQAWQILLRLTKDIDGQVSSSASKSLGAAFSHVPDKNKYKAWNDLHSLTENKDYRVRMGIAEALGLSFKYIPNKDQAWIDLHRLTEDRSDWVRRASAWAIGNVFPHIPEKEQAWTDLHRLAEDEISGVRWATARALGDAFPNIPDKEQAWADLIRLTSDNYEEVRETAAESLGSAYPYVPDKNQAWNDLHILTEDEDESVRHGIAMSFGIAYPHIPEEKQAWDDLHRLSLDNSVFVRMWAAKSIGMAFSHISDRQQAQRDLHRLTEDEDSRVRWRASEALSLAYPHIPDKEQASVDLQRLAEEEDKNVSLAADDALDRIGDQIRSQSTIGNQMRARSDLRSSEDLLGFEDYAKAFADLIESPYTDPPLTIGIYGSWGMGKSSLLGQIDEKLKKRHNSRQQKNGSTSDTATSLQVHVINFNAWEYSASEVVWPGLVRKIIDEMEPKKLSKYYPRYFISKLLHNRNQRSRKALGKFLFVIVFVCITSFFALLWLRFDTIDVLSFLQSGVEGGAQDATNMQNVSRAILFALGASGLLGIILSLLKILEYTFKPLSQWTTKLFQECDYGKQIGFMEEIHEDLSFLEGRLDKKKERILVVIDDLDRCEPGKAVEVLQAINLLLSFKSFIVCLGIDARIITRAVEKHYKNLLGPSGASGYEYLEKIVQIPFRIPEPNQDEVNRFIAEQLGNPKPPVGKKIEPPVDKKIEPPVDKKIEPPVNRSPSTHIPFTYPELDAFQSLVGFLRPNPRHMKRLINVYSFARTLAKYKKQNAILDNPNTMIFWLVICGQWPYTMHAMLRHFDKISKNGIESLPDKNPLIYLLEEALKSPQFSHDTQVKLDYDLDKLDQLLHEKGTLLSWSQLRDLRQYTINFNPAIEAELRFEVEDYVEDDKSPASKSSCNS